jgi:hypothetical protein
MFCFLIYVVYTKTYFDGEKERFEILSDLQILSLPEYEKWFLVRR